MLNKKIRLQVHYYPVHLQKFYRDKYGFKNNDFPNAEKFYKEEVSLPIYPALNRKQTSYIVETINEVLNFRNLKNS